jgi:hypothetical protein
MFRQPRLGVLVANQSFEVGMSTQVPVSSSLNQSLRSLSSEALLREMARAIAVERTATLEVVRYIGEIYRRRLYLECGYSSLFEMLTRYFGYCNGSAQIRINSMRLLKEVPEIAEKLQTGELTLTNASQVQSFFWAEQKDSKIYSKEEKMQLIEECVGKSTRLVSENLATRNPEFIKKEIVRSINAIESRVSVTMGKELIQKIDVLRNLLSHKNPNMSLEEIIRIIVDLALEKLDPKSGRAREAATTKPGGSSRPESGGSRYIPQALRREVWRQNADKGCEYISKGSGVRCGSKRFLQIDHIVPFSRGGKHEIGNLRLLCAQHNQWRYGRE